MGKEELKKADANSIKLLDCFVEKWNKEIIKDNEMYCIPDAFVVHFKKTYKMNLTPTNTEVTERLKVLADLKSVSKSDYGNVDAIKELDSQILKILKEYPLK